MYRVHLPLLIGTLLFLSLVAAAGDGNSTLDSEQFQSEMQKFWNDVDSAAIIEPELAMSIDTRASYLALSSEVQLAIKSFYSEFESILTDTNYVSLKAQIRLGDILSVALPGTFDKIRCQLTQQDIRFIEAYLQCHSDDSVARDSLELRKRVLLQMKQGTWDE
jgi:hypothetical protein